MPENKEFEEGEIVYPTGFSTDNYKFLDMIQAKTIRFIETRFVAAHFDGLPERKSLARKNAEIVCEAASNQVLTKLWRALNEASLQSEFVDILAAALEYETRPNMSESEADEWRASLVIHIEKTIKLIDETPRQMESFFQHLDENSRNYCGHYVDYLNLRPLKKYLKSARNCNYQPSLNGYLKKRTFFVCVVWRWITLNGFDQQRGFKSWILKLTNVIFSENGNANGELSLVAFNKMIREQD